MTIEIPQKFEDEDTMLRSMMSVGAYRDVIEKEGEDVIAGKIVVAAAPFRTEHGGYLFENNYLLRVFGKEAMKDQAAESSA